MNVETIIFQVKNINFRPIPIDYLTTLIEYVEKEFKYDEEKKKQYDSIFRIELSEFVKLVINTFFCSNENDNLFLLSCVCLRIGDLERNTSVPNFQTSQLRWEDYLNLSRDSSVSKYSINSTFIAVLFKTSFQAYVYSYSKTGLLGTEYMKQCAVRGDGLGHCTAKYFRNHQGFSIIY